MKTNRLSLLLVLGVLLSPRAQALNDFECLRDLLPVTEHGSFQASRRGVEAPFMIDDKYMIFPEAREGQVSGFFVYDREGGHYYDAVVTAEGAKKPVSSLPGPSRTVYQLMAQPRGLETVIIPYLPGFNTNEGNKDGPVVLGSSVLPVVGALVSRPKSFTYAYQSPREISEERLKEWIYHHAETRSPASIDQIQIQRPIVKLATLKPKVSKELMAPLARELEIRRRWVESANLDDVTFGKLQLVMKTTCNRTR